MARKVGNGEGSLFQRKDGRWVAVVWDEREGRRRHLYGKTREEARDKMFVAQGKNLAGTPLGDDGITVKQYLAYWLETVERRNKPRTHASYSDTVSNYINPTIGHLRLRDLDDADVDRMMNRAPTVHTANYARRILRIALNRAIRGKKLTWNAATAADHRQQPRHEARFLTLDQAKVLLAAVKGSPDEGLYTVALALGCRQGEALGLQWSDVNLAARTLTVRHQLQRPRKVAEPRTGTGWELVPTKTDQVATLDLPDGVVTALRRHQQAQRELRMVNRNRWQESDFVFTTSIGTPIDASNLVGRFHKTLASAGLPKMSWHELRHSCASILISQGASLEEVKAVLRHSQISVTSRFYVHLMPGALREVADKMDGALFGVAG